MVRCKIERRQSLRHGLRRATVSLRLGHGVGLTVHRTVIQHHAAASLLYTREAFRCGGKTPPVACGDSPLLAEGAFSAVPGQSRIQIIPPVFSLIIRQSVRRSLARTSSGMRVSLLVSPSLISS